MHNTLHLDEEKFLYYYIRHIFLVIYPNITLLEMKILHIYVETVRCCFFILFYFIYLYIFFNLSIQSRNEDQKTHFSFVFVTFLSKKHVNF